jgi:hypothetical protein
MSSPIVDGVGAEEASQDICERLINQFDYFAIRDGPHRGVVILRFVGFGAVTFVGIDPEVARVGDIAIEIAHNGFHTRVKVWSKREKIKGGRESVGSQQGSLESLKDRSIARVFDQIVDPTFLVTILYS